ncbi:MAG: apolipoprotein N-acyltransferase, partial [Spirochaetota bacterium]
PETVVNSSMIFHEKLASILSSLMNDDSMLITGAVSRPNGKQVYNSAYAISGDGQVARYDKNILLPYAESSPLGVEILDNYYTAPDSFHRGKTLPVIKMSSGTIGISICFEQVYPSYIRRSVGQGATILVNISNDAWFGDTTQPGQHLNCSIIRAVEHRRYLVRAANSGYSAIISPAGELSNVTSLFSREAGKGRVQFIEQKSLYTRYGDMIMYLALVILLSILAIEAFKKD